jgi:XTP/dITP diphosphohydrolase
MKIATGSELVVASHNPGKVREIRELLELFSVTTLVASELGIPEAEETGSTFEENAALKARAAASASGRVALADDSGLVVDALDGAPGIYSARWAGAKKDFRAAMARVERELKERGAETTTAAFVCALAVSVPDGETKTFRGEVSGHLAFPPRGDKGFGYDPIFVANGMKETFGEIDPKTKHGMSHRARAFEQLVRSGIFAR